MRSLNNQRKYNPKRFTLAQHVGDRGHFDDYYKVYIPMHGTRNRRPARSPFYPTDFPEEFHGHTEVDGRIPSRGVFKRRKYRRTRWVTPQDKTNQRIVNMVNYGYVPTTSYKLSSSKKMGRTPFLPWATRMEEIYKRLSSN